MGLEWSEHRKPCPECRYDHVVADVGAGQIYITWKGHKTYPSYDVELPEIMSWWGPYDDAVPYTAYDLPSAKEYAARMLDIWARAVVAACCNLYGREAMCALVYDACRVPDNAGITSSLG